VDDAAERTMDETWTAMTYGAAAAPETLTVKGRNLQVPVAAGKAARFSFADLCEAPLGARDYKVLADRFDTFFVDHVPVLGSTLRNATKRFILLIDTLYDQGKRLVVSAAAAPDNLYAGRAATTEAFEFDRTASRLIEMQSRDWLEAWAERQDKQGEPQQAAPDRAAPT
jgi:cell division protein ZapE